MSFNPVEFAMRGTSVHACYSHALADNPVLHPVKSLQKTYSLF